MINPIIYAEVSIGYSTIEALDAALPTTLYQREPQEPAPEIASRPVGGGTGAVIC